MNKRSIGKQKEDLAAEFLKRQGLEILERNFSCKMGEIDIIGLDENCLVFIEVKYRKNTSYGYPQDAVSINKKRKIILVSGYYRMLRGVSDNSLIRFDVVSILGNKIRWDKNAF